MRLKLKYIGLVCAVSLIAAGSLFPTQSTVFAQDTQQIEVRDNEVLLRADGEIPLNTLVDYVARRLNMRILYDDSTRTKNIRLIAPEPIPMDRLYDVLQSILLAEGLVTGEPDAAGVRRITATSNIATLAQPSSLLQDLEGIGPAVPLTRLYALKNLDAAKAVELLKPFLSDNAASIVALENRNSIIITDVAANIRRIAGMIDLLDGGGPAVDVRFVSVRHVRADELADQLQELLQARQRAEGRGEGDATGIEVTVNARTNQVVLVGNRVELERAEELLRTLDVALPTVQRSFTLEYISPERFNEVLQGILSGRSVAPPYRANAEGNVLILESTEEVLELAARIRLSLDTREAPLSQSPIRFYKIKNVPAEELAATLRGLGGQVAATSRDSLPPRRRTSNDQAVPGPNVNPLLNPGSAQPVQIPPTPPSYRESRDAGIVGERDPVRPEMGISDPAGSLAGESMAGAFAPEGNTQGMLAAANVSVDVHTNTIIVLASPETQRIYASLIEELDQRRPQVLVEAKIVIIDTSDNYSLGVEVSGGDRLGAKRLFAFSSYGLSEIDPVNGALQVIPGVGFNGTLVDPTTADVVVRAIAQHRRARVLSTPRVLVNDNAEGQLTSVLEVPFTSVNASQTVATTSFAGFAEAGTTISVRPTISEDNYLQLEYVVTLNSFSGQGAAGVPPPRQTNEVRSRVTVPDGYTVIVGGLVSKNGTYEVDSIPFLEKIPIIRDLASLQTRADTETSLFVFLKPVILREDKFRDLKFLSGVSQHAAKIEPDYPPSSPLSVE